MIHPALKVRNAMIFSPLFPLFSDPDWLFAMTGVLMMDAMPAQACCDRLAEACKAGTTDALVGLLSVKGAIDINAANEKGSTALHAAWHKL